MIPIPIRVARFVLVTPVTMTMTPVELSRTFRAMGRGMRMGMSRWWFGGEPVFVFFVVLVSTIPLYASSPLW